MKVFFVGSELDGCYNVRALFPLQTNGWDGDRTTFIAYRMTPENKALAAKASEVVVFHRPEREGKLEMMKLLKKAGKKVVFDNDDTYKDDGGVKFTDLYNEERIKSGLKKLNEAIDECIKEADLVTCSTEFLKKEYEQINPNVVVLPNYIDPFYFPEPLRNEDDTVRIGITGSIGITSDMELVKPIIEHYKDNPKVKFVLFSLPPDHDNELYKKIYKEDYEFWSNLPVEWQPFTPAEEYYETLNNLKIDIAIIPRADNYFNRCKSNLKFLEDSMLEIPCICQAFDTGDSPYQVNPEDSKYLLLANTLDEWIAQMDKLIADKELRREMGKKAREYVENNYDIADHAYKWEEAYKKLYE